MGFGDRADTDADNYAKVTGLTYPNSTDLIWHDSSEQLTNYPSPIGGFE